VAKHKSESDKNKKRTEAELNSASPVGEILSVSTAGVSLTIADPKTMANETLAELVIVRVKGLKEIIPHILILRQRFLDLKGTQTIAGCRTWIEFCPQRLGRSDRWVRQLIEDSGEENPAARFANTGTAAQAASPAAAAPQETQTAPPAAAEVQPSTQEVTASAAQEAGEADEETEQEPEAALVEVGLKIKGYDLAILQATILRTVRGRIKQDGFDQTNMTTVRKTVYTIVSNLLLAFEYNGDETFTPAVGFPNKDYLTYEIFIRQDREDMKAAKAEAERKKLLAAEELEKTTADAAAKPANKPKTKGASAGA
jgi:hypothetical protein